MTLAVPIAAAIAGGWIGGLQTRVLQERLPPLKFTSYRIQWISATAIGGSIAFSLFVAALAGLPVAAMLRKYLGVYDYILSLHLVIWIAALILATIQWGVLRRYVQGALWWIPASVAAWIVGSASATWFTQTLFNKPGPTPDGTISSEIVFPPILNLGISTLIWGALTGLMIIWLLRRLTPA